MSSEGEEDSEFQEGNRILVLDCGSQVTHLITRRLRASGVYALVLPCHSDAAAVRKLKPQGLIFSGGPDSVLATDSMRVDPKLFSLKLPILGICFGEQLLCAQLKGGRIGARQNSEYGLASLEILQACSLFDGLWSRGERIPVWMSHADEVLQIPEGFRVVARTEGAPFALIADEARQYYGVQFHPEVAHTRQGAELLAMFAKRICSCSGGFRPEDAIEQAITSLKARIGEGRVLCALSGGVDSSVAALLVQLAVGERTHCVFLDNGLLREGEAQFVENSLRRYFDKKLVVLESQEKFLTALKGVRDPEQKRKIIGRKFIECFEKHAQKLEKIHGEIKFLGQGTLYPDVIESPNATARQAGAGSRAIKSHHNVGGLPKRMKFALVEPLRKLFKDEVREIGRKLGLEEAFLMRHPFPGPGLAVRIPGEVTKEKCDRLRKADKIFLAMLREHNLYHKIWQAFAVLLPVKSVGVMGDARSYDACCVLRAVRSEDAMTAQPFPLAPAFLQSVATRIVNEVPGINRVLYDCTSKPPATIEWE